MSAADLPDHEAASPARWLSDGGVYQDSLPQPPAICVVAPEPSVPALAATPPSQSRKGGVPAAAVQQPQQPARPKQQNLNVATPASRAENSKKSPASADPCQPVPGAPVRDTRRPRPREEWTVVTQGLAAGLSGMRLRDEPPAKKVCRPTAFMCSEVTTQRGSSSSTAVVAPQTPLRRPGSSLRARLHGMGEGAKGLSTMDEGQSPFTFCEGAATGSSKLKLFAASPELCIPASCLGSRSSASCTGSSFDENSDDADLGDISCQSDDHSGLGVLRGLFEGNSGSDSTSGCSRVLLFEESGA